MALSPEQIEKKKFSRSHRGYDKKEVRKFLDSVASSVRGMEDQLKTAVSTASSDSEPDHVEGQATTDEQSGHTAPASDEFNENDSPADELEQEIIDRYGALGDRIAEMLRTADATAAQLRSDAEVDSAQTRTEAELEASQLLAESRTIRQEADTYRAEVESSAELLQSDAQLAAEAAAETVRVQVIADALASLEERESAIEAAEESAASDKDAARVELEDAKVQAGAMLEQARSQSEFIKQEADEIIRTKVRANMESAQSRLDVLRNTEVASRERIVSAQRELEAALARLDSEAPPVLDSSGDFGIIEEAERRSAEVAETDDGSTFAGAAFIDTTATETSPDDVVRDEEVAHDAPDSDEELVDAAEESDDHGHDNDHEDDDDDAGDGQGQEDALARLVREAMQEAVDSARKND